MTRSTTMHDGAGQAVEVGGATPASAAPSGRRSAGGAARFYRRYGQGLLLLAPAAILFGVAFAYPLGFVVDTSLNNGLADYKWAIGSSVNQDVFLKTFVMGFGATLVCCILAYPYAYVMSIVRPSLALVMFGVVLVPFWTSTLIRSFAWVTILQPKGVLNWLLDFVSLGPTSLLGTTAAVIIGMTQVLLPFAVLPMYAVMNRIDHRVITAAQSLGAPRIKAFYDAYFPLSMPGVLAGFGIVFVLSLGFYITPALLGSPRDSMVSVLISAQVQGLGNWERGAALGVLLLLGTLLSLAVLGLLSRRYRRWSE
jgi:putative spermidine/putrescine transport system permease protein